MRRSNSRRACKGNPGLMFAQGVEHIVREKLHNPTVYDDQEARKLEKKAKTEEETKSLFSWLFRQLT